MMPLDLMTRFAGVAPNWTSPLARQIADRWVGEETDVRVWRASANFVCVVTGGGAKYYLRFNHAEERSYTAICAELEWIQHLERSGCVIAAPAVSRAGNIVETVITPLGRFHAVLFHALPGSHREFDTLSLPDFETWGRTLGQIHAHSQNYHVHGRPAWTDYVDLAARHISEHEAALRAELVAVERRLRDLPITSSSFGLIHYDFELDNLIWHEERAGVLDFDDCAHYWYAADIAYALRDLFDDSIAHLDLAHPSLQAFVHGYRTAFPISDACLQRLSLFLRLHNLVLFARISRSLGASPPAEEPGWAVDLRTTLTGMLDKVRADVIANPYAGA